MLRALGILVSLVSLGCGSVESKAVDGLDQMLGDEDGYPFAVELVAYQRVESSDRTGRPLLVDSALFLAVGQDSVLRAGVAFEVEGWRFKDATDGGGKAWVKLEGPDLSSKAEAFVVFWWNPHSQFLVAAKAYEDVWIEHFGTELPFRYTPGLPEP